MSTTTSPTWETSQRIGPPRVLGFAIGKVGSAVFTTVPGLLLLFYMTDTLGVHAALAGLVVVLPKLWDIVCAALVGSWSDRDAAKRGRRTRLMMIGTLTLPLLFVLLFAGPGDGNAAVLWVLVAYVLAATAFEMFDIPYLALPSEMTASPRERTRLMGWRIIATTIGVLLAGAVAPSVVDGFGGGRHGYLVMAVSMGVLLFVAMLACTLSTRWVDALPSSSYDGTLRAALRAARANRAFVLLISAYLPHAVAISIFQAAMAYVASYLLGDYGLMAILFIALMAPSIIAVPIWSRVSHRIGKAPTFAIATTAYGLASLALLPAILWAGTGVVLAVAVVLGIAFAGEQVMVYSMIPDTIVHEYNQSGRNTAGLLSGLFQSLETAAFAVGAWVFSLILAGTGYVSSTFDEPITQTQQAQDGIMYGFTVLPALLLLATLPLIAAYRRTAAAQYGDQTEDSYRAPAPVGAAEEG